MVIFAGVLVIVFQGIRNNQLKGAQAMTAFLRFCSNDTAMMNAANLPLNFTDWNTLTLAENTDKKFNVNYYMLRAGSASTPCVNWLEDDYPISSPYALGSSAVLNRDTYVIP